MKVNSLRKARRLIDDQVIDLQNVNPNQFDSSSIGFQLRDTYNAWVRSSQGIFGRFGITFTMWLLLLRLWQEKGLTQKELIDHAALMQSSTSTVINKLTRLGLVNMQISSLDRRKVRYFLSVKGRSMVHRLTPTAVELRSTALKNFSPQEVSLLGNLLSRIKHNLQGANGKSHSTKESST